MSQRRIWQRGLFLGSACGLLAWQAYATQQGLAEGPRATQELDGHGIHTAHGLTRRPVIPAGGASVGAPAVDALPAGAQNQDPALRAASYFALDDTPRTVTNFNAEAVRPMVFSPDGLDLYAVNTHGNTVVRHQNTSSAPEGTFDVAMNPVALALHGDDLWVVCQGTECVLRLDRFTGVVTHAIHMRGEPSDIVIDDTAGVAYVSLPGTDELASIDLDTLAVDKYLNRRSKRGRFLALEADGSVMIAPELSGNNSTTVGGPGTATVVDLDDPTVSPDGLPDEDLFRFDPSTGTFAPVFKGMGSILFAHGRNPDTGQYWICNIQSLNKDPELQSEPAVNGAFAVNALTIGDDSGGGLSGPTRIVDLDDWNPLAAGTQIDPNRTVSMPQSLAFTSAGFAFIAGSNSDRVTALDPAGDRLLDFIVPDGGIPQGLVVDPTTETLLIVFGWGTNKLYVYNLISLDPNPVATLDLGGDPTPESVQAGRELFYDASHSSDNRFTCGHCHPRGNTDGLVWNISNTPFDNKGPMVTQPLFGIESLSPFHWRGERQLIDFNAAFPGLLGADGGLDESPGGAFAQFEEFIFSLTTPSSPRESIHRRLEFDPDATPLPNGHVGDPVRGQDVFLFEPAIIGVSCVFCHSGPNGTSGDPINEIGSPFAARVAQDVTAFSNGTIGLKDQDEVTLTLFGNSVDKPFLGGGLTHAGTVDTFFDFSSDLGALNVQQQADLTEFLLKYDQGTSPAAQFVRILDSEETAKDASRIENILLRQARRGWIDVAAIGTFPIDGNATELRWVFDPETSLFRPDDSELAPVTFADFVAHSAADEASNMFIGLPPGNGETFAIDVDGDGLRNQDEALYGTEPNDLDSDDDTFPDGYEVAHGSDPLDGVSVPFEADDPQFTKAPELIWINTGSAKITFETDELTHWEVDYETPGVDPIVVRSLDASTVHTVVLHDLFPSTPDFNNVEYVGTVRVIDLSGNEATEPLPPMTTAPAFLGAPPFVGVLNEPSVERARRGADTLDAAVEFRTDLELGGPPFFAVANRVVIAELLVNGENHSDFTSSRATAFDLNGAPYSALPGPFLISSISSVDGSPNDGRVELDFVATGLSPGDVVTVNVVMVPEIDPDTWDSTGTPNVPAGGQLLWSLPDTRPEARSITITF